MKIQGVFPWHLHEDCDEMFLVWKPLPRRVWRPRRRYGPGDYTVVPRRIEHCTAVDDEAEVTIFEPAEVRNAGNVVDDTFTAPQGVKI
ncbi:mannose-6-phosphate isomerase [Rhodopseudomonas palustris]|uniref:mannose-6-phosphate isomerase n=1 Tax=Rhodopseudomonas palustris TaxID=1076 RepID=UPI000164A599|nr:mannose-6-phosphate isomerase [Rhodopseudomonas palustris]